jgi:hypothetical protein
MSMTTTPTGAGYVVNIDGVAPVWVAVPASATAPGIRWQMAADANFLYICIAVNTWVRGGLTTW